MCAHLHMQWHLVPKHPGVNLPPRPAIHITATHTGSSKINTKPHCRYFFLYMCMHSALIECNETVTRRRLTSWSLLVKSVQKGVLKKSTAVNSATFSYWIWIDASACVIVCININALVCGVWTVCIYGVCVFPSVVVLLTFSVSCSEVTAFSSHGSVVNEPLSRYVLL